MSVCFVYKQTSEICYWSDVLINVEGNIRSFSVVRHNSSSSITMSGAKGGGKATGTRPRIVTTRSNEGREDNVNYPARDIRLDEVEGTGTRVERSGSQRPRHVPRYTCGTCHDLCCGLARELVTTAFGLGRTSMSRWVSEVVPIFEVNFTFQDFDKAMSRGLKRARAMQGGGDREGAIMVVESEVGQVDL